MDYYISTIRCLSMRSDLNVDLTFDTVFDLIVE